MNTRGSQHPTKVTPIQAARIRLRVLTARWICCSKRLLLSKRLCSMFWCAAVSLSIGCSAGGSLLHARLLELEPLCSTLMRNLSSLLSCLVLMLLYIASSSTLVPRCVAPSTVTMCVYDSIPNNLQADCSSGCAASPQCCEAETIAMDAVFVNVASWKSDVPCRVVQSANEGLNT